MRFNDPLRRCIQAALTILAIGAAAGLGPPSTSPARAIALTDAAANEIKTIAKEQGLRDWYLYVAVKKAEKGEGFTYVLDLNEDKPKPGDEVLSDQGVNIRVDDASVPYLFGVVIDFRDDNAGKGFVFRNPNAKSEK